MKLKSTLSDFIKKYNLGGNVEAVKWSISGKEISTDVITEDKGLIGKVVYDDVDMDDMEVGIFITSNFVKVLDVFGDSLAIKMNSIDGRPINFELGDADTKAQYMLADLSVIPAAAKPKNLPSFQLSVPITSELIGKISKAKGALPDISHITFNTKSGTPEIIIGYSKNNTTRISFDIKADVEGDVQYKSFNSNYLVEIFKANSNMKSGTIEVSNAGLMRVVCMGDGFKSEYFLVEVQHT